MINNDILRRLRYTFDFDDNKMIGIFALAGMTVSRDEVRAWLKQDEDAEYQTCGNTAFVAFLDGLIIEKRGPKDGPAAVPDLTLNNNVVFRKLKIALNLQAEDILELLGLVEFRMSKHELSAFFRKVDHKHYRECKDQILRNFLNGIQQKFHTAKPESVEQWKKKVEAKTYVKGAKKPAKTAAKDGAKGKVNSAANAGPNTKPKASSVKPVSDAERLQKELAESRKGRPAGEKKTLGLKKETPAPVIAPVAAQPIEQQPAKETKALDDSEQVKAKAAASAKAKSGFKF